MSSPFPKLLRKANIATYDPLISRIYTTTPSSNYRYGDWGLKFAIHRTKGPRYVKFMSLDSGPGFNCDWRSGEREARFIEAWGSGRVNWSDESTSAQSLRTKNLDGFGSSMVQPLKKKKVLVRDIETMSEEDFEEYLDQIRGEGKKYLGELLGDLAESTQSGLVHPEDRTFVHLAISGSLPENTVPTIEASIQTARQSSPTNNYIYSKPHDVFGLSYVEPPTANHAFNPTSSFPGRAVNQVSRFTAQHQIGGTSGFSRGGGSNNAWVMSLGGATGSTTRDQPPPGHIGNNDVEEVDYTREQPKKGRYKLTPLSALVKEPPTILALAESGAGNKWAGRWRKKASVPSPLDTFAMDLKVAPLEEELDVGSPQWITHEPKKYFSMSLGGPRADRDRSTRGRLFDQEQQQMGKITARQNRQDALGKVSALLQKFRQNRKTEEGQ